jgi:hypothetical protein
MSNKSIGVFNSVFDSFLDESSFFSDQAKTVSITIESDGVTDDITGETTGGTVTTYTAKGFRRDVEFKEFREVMIGDMVFTCKISDLGYEPKPGNAAVIDGVTYKVIDCKNLGQVSYAMQLRS